MKPISEEAWTTRRLLEWITRHLERQQVHNPTLVARMLLVHVVGGIDIDLYTDPDRPATASERDRLRGLVSRAPPMNQSSIWSEGRFLRPLLQGRCLDADSPDRHGIADPDRA